MNRVILVAVSAVAMAGFPPPRFARSAEVGNFKITDKARAFWSFQPLRRVTVPKVDNAQWCRTPVDQFILAKFDRHNLRPARVASREKLLRRVTLDLLGLPPAGDDVAAFVADADPDAWERLVDRFLASPRYGERWARHWLDVVRFAESYGFEHDLDNDHAWHFRDFVIRAFNNDLPFDRFVQWQIAGDELAPGQPMARIATGFLAAGVHNADIAKVRVEQERYDELDDLASTVGSALLGLSIGCARCHDHRYDPISQENYYQFIANFERTIRGEVEMVLEPGSAAVKVLVAGEGLTPLARVYNPGPAFFKKTWFLRRGEARLKDHQVSPQFLNVLTPAGASADIWRTKAPGECDSTLRRSALARWLTDVRRGAGSLLARVIVNRLWQHHFGRGIVGTANDFGSRGGPPTHPALLDWLAGELVRSGWSLKHLHRLILNSAVYRQSVLGRRRTELDERLFLGRPVRRLESEAIRDSMLVLSGRFDEKMFGPGTLDEEQPRRSVYFRVKRSRLIPLMSLFDCPDTLQSIGKRPVTTVAPQALALMNSPRIERFAQGFARRLNGAAGAGRGADFQSARQVENLPHKNRPLHAIVPQAWQQALGREPTRFELTEAVEFVKQQTAEYTLSAKQLVLVDQPSGRKSLVLWLDASTVASSSDDVSSRPTVAFWRDRLRDDSPSVLRPITKSRPVLIRESTPQQRPAVHFGPNATILRDDVPSLNFGTGDFTVTVMFRLDEKAGDDNQILGKDSYPGAGNSYTGWFLQHQRRRLRFSTRNLRKGQGPVNYLDSKTSLQKGRWHQATGVRRSGRLSLFLDGQAEPDVSAIERSPTNIDTPAGFKIGDMDEHKSGALHGDIAEVLVYSRALTNREVAASHGYLRQKYFGRPFVDPREQALTDLCQALFCLNEFIYVE